MDDDDDQDLEETKDIPFIRLENVHKTYLLGVEGIAALRGVDLEVQEGEFLMICGTSGGGKSTMLNIMGTIDKPTKGRVTICRKIITPRTSDDELAKIRLENLGFVFQTFNLLSSMNALENVELPLTFLGYGSSTRKEIATKLLESVQMGDRLKHYPSMLSGGEQQRVTIARAMANQPGLLLLDEPTGDLDTLNTNNVMRLLINLNNAGTTLVMVTHDMNLVPYGTRVVYMRDGKVHGGRVFSPEERAAKIAELEEQIGMGRDGSKGSNALGGYPVAGSYPVANSSSSSSSSAYPPATPTTPSTVYPARTSPGSSPPCYPNTYLPPSSSSSDGIPIIPMCTSIREPGDYDPISAADPTMCEAVGYEISVQNYPQIIQMRPYRENPYSNLRKEVVARSTKMKPGESSSSSSSSSSSFSGGVGEEEYYSRPSSEDSKHSNSQYSNTASNVLANNSGSPHGSPSTTIFVAAPPSPLGTPASFAASTPTPGIKVGGGGGGGGQGVSALGLAPVDVNVVDVNVSTWQPMPDSPPN